MEHEFRGRLLELGDIADIALESLDAFYGLERKDTLTAGESLGAEIPQPNGSEFDGY